MAKIEIFYLAVVLTTFAVFMSALAFASWDYERNKRSKPSAVARNPGYPSDGQIHA